MKNKKIIKEVDNILKSAEKIRQETEPKEKKGRIFGDPVVILE